MQTLLLTTITLVAFAANSVLCRMALAPAAIDPISFTVIRLLSGALVLVPVTRTLAPPSESRRAGSWLSALALLGYAIAFSLAYVTLDAGTGALILFGCVQITMLGWGLRTGERPCALEWFGLIAALSGLVYLVLPGLTAPSITGASLMAGAGVAWGIYSLRGRGTASPIATTAGNFARSVPLMLLAVPVVLLAAPPMHRSDAGLALAATSGAITSGLGYVAWYAALKGLTATSASIAQLSVPVIAALGGVVLLGEQISLRLLLASALVLGGVAAAIGGRRRTRQ